MIGCRWPTKSLKLTNPPIEISSLLDSRRHRPRGERHHSDVARLLEGCNWCNLIFGGACYVLPASGVRGMHLGIVPVEMDDRGRVHNGDDLGICVWCRSHHSTYLTSVRTVTVGGDGAMLLGFWKLFAVQSCLQCVSVVESTRSLGLSSCR